jgi:TRAP-type uncharacterized transport system, fused permease components
VAQSDPLKTGFQAFTLAFAGFIVPFIFVLNPALVLQGPALDAVWGTATCLIGIIPLSGALQGWFLNCLPMTRRLILGAGGLGLLHPGMISSLVGFGILLAVSFYELRIRRKVAALANE